MTPRQFLGDRPTPELAQYRVPGVEGSLSAARSNIPVAAVLAGAAGCNAHHDGPEDGSQNCIRCALKKGIQNPRWIFCVRRTALSGYYANVAVRPIMLLEVDFQFAY
jgi:hypothetical protein